MTFYHFYQMFRLHQPRHVIVGWIAMFLIGLGIIKIAAGAEDWRAAARVCVEQVSNSLGGCGSCNAAWPQIAKCVVSRTAPDMPSWIVDACVYAVRTRTTGEPLGFDRVGPVLACVTREPVKP